MNHRIIFNILGRVIILESLLMLPSSFIGLFYQEWRDAIIYAVVTLGCLALGVALSHIKPASSTFYTREGFVATTLSWIVISLLGALPFYFSSDIDTFTDALFEIISGFTTTGASILVNVENVSHANLFWRSFSQWIGGMGVLVFILAILPMSGGSTMNLMKAESPGPTTGKLVPRVQQTAFFLYAIYIVMTAIEFILLLIGGMAPFDALLHSLSTAATGGFGTRNDSMAGYSAYCQVIVTIFMFLFGINFTYYYYLLIRKVRYAFAMEEVHWYVRILITACVVIAIDLTLHTDDSFGSNLLYSIFQSVSIMTTSGYVTCDFNAWPMLSKAVLIALMFIGACAGSTSGGIKVSRIVLYVKQIFRDLMQQIHPRQISMTKLDGKGIEHATLRSCNVFLMAYIMVFSVSFFLICLNDFDFTTSFSSVLAALGNIGPGFALIGPTGNYSSFSTLSKYVLMFDMLAGRLEVIPMLIFLHPKTWSKQ